MESPHTNPALDHRFLKWEQLSKCPVCGSEDIGIAYPPSVARCEACNVLFQTPRPTQEEIGRSYNAGASFEQWSRSDNLAKLMMWLKRFLLFAPMAKGGSLLDIGTGDGYFVDLAKTYGFETFGTDLSETGAAFAMKRGHRIHVGQVEEAEFAEASFDVVTIWHVLEHLPEPGRTLAHVFKLLKPGGILAVAVPNEENHLFRQRCGLLRTGNPIGTSAFGHEIHLTHFTPRTLKRAIRQSGFEVIRFGVDDLYVERSARNLAVLYFHKALARVFGWHFNMAMFVVARKPVA